MARFRLNTNFVVSGGASLRNYVKSQNFCQLRRKVGSCIVIAIVQIEQIQNGIEEMERVILKVLGKNKNRWSHAKPVILKSIEALL